MDNFLIYAAVFRLSVMLVGILSIYFGYRLFVLGVMPREGTNIEAASNEMNLTIKNAAPGTIFALFGVFVIGLMVVQGNPEYSVSVKDGNPVITVRGGALSEEKRGLSLTEVDVEEIKNQTKMLLQNKMIKKEAALPLLKIAKVYFRKQWYDSAMALTNLVITLDSENHDEAIQLKKNIVAARGY